MINCLPKFGIIIISYTDYHLKFRLHFKNYVIVFNDTEPKRNVYFR